VKAIVGHLAKIASEEGVTVEQEALRFIAYHSTGAMRDAISFLDQLTSYGDEITLDQAKMVLGTVASESAAGLAAHLIDDDLAGGLALINSAVGDGADPRQFGRDVVEYLRGLLLIQQGAGTRLLSATEEQAAEMEALAQRTTAEQLLRSIRLFNEAVTDLRRGLHTIPQLPLELALVESRVEPENPLTSAQTVRQEQVLYQTSSHTAPKPKRSAPKAETSQAKAEEVSPPPPAASPAQTPTDEGEETSTEQESPAQQRSAGSVTLGQVEQAWAMVLHAVRQRNPATEGALRSQCKPVEVAGDEIVITFPFQFLREKLVEPKRKGEIQDALSEVLNTECRVKLVQDSDYVPTVQVNPTPPPVAPSQPNSAQEAPDTQLDEEQVTEEVTRWAEERGGQVKIVPADSP
jgi:DNA polymerase-3 subunit gamma/tau